MKKTKKSKTPRTITHEAFDKLLGPVGLTIGTIICEPYSKRNPWRYEVGVDAGINSTSVYWERKYSKKGRGYRLDVNAFSPESAVNHLWRIAIKARRINVGFPGTDFFVIWNEKEQKFIKHVCD